MNKKVLAAVAVATTAVAPAVAMADLSANVGWVSEYIYRGVYQEESAASGGLDYESDSGFYIGTWGSDVGEGLEVDLYFGYGGETEGGLGWSIGWTGYYYTEDEPAEFYDTITEVNLGLSYGIFALDHAVGEEDGFGSPTDYTFTSITISPDTGPYYMLGMFGDEADGSYFEIGHGFSAMDIDFNIAFLTALSDSDPMNVIELTQEGFGSKHALVFGASKTIDLSD